MKRFLALLTLALMLLTLMPASAEGADTLTMRVLNVGKADAMIITCGGESALIDAGWKQSAQKVLETLASAEITSLKYAVGTHPDKDHIGGLAEVLASVPAGEVLLSPKECDDSTYLKLMNSLKMMKITPVRPLEGYTFSVGSAVFTVLSPNADLLPIMDENEASIVLSVDFHDKKLLLMGDALLGTEQMLYYGKQLQKADVLKVGHHGEDDATGSLLLSAVDPQICVISTGLEKEGGRISDSVLAALTGRQVYRTDTDGDIVITVSESGISTAVSGFPKSDKYILDIKKKVFHLPTCTDLPKPKNQGEAASRDEALAADYIPCKVCNP
ncbi:MAG: MBL fold metallo-hydrolase [Eubacteriales bacterium]|nr:MBL fold metallo-hydrolase [Eubacteriales bacterium]MDD3880893.1 MBL fold metallo-hydrolase [Eubacteriales bacterium]MDD4511740.1 MBL fold metallo-hydrolase [Eubacteriales bacterium]